MFFLVCVSTVAEHVETYMQMNPKSTPFFAIGEMCIGSVYFLAHLGTGLAYFIYILAVLDIYYPLKNLKGFLGVTFCYLVGVVFVVFNFFHPVLFHYTEDGIYHRDAFIFVYYILAAYYLIAGMYFIHRYSKLIKLQTKIIIGSYVLFVFLGLLIQYLIPELLIENFFVTISITFLYITLQNPSEMVDESLNILNRKAFLEGLDLKTKRNSPHFTIFVTIDNMRTLCSEIGFDHGQDALKKIAKYLKNVGFKELRLSTYTYRYSEYIFAITVHSSDETKANALMYKISYRLHEPWDFSGMTIKVEGHVFLMKYPELYRTSAELITKVEMLGEGITSYHDSVVDVEKVDFNSIKKARDFDRLARENLDQKKAVIKFQPFLSKIYKIGYSADVYCYLKDDLGNEIDMRNKIPDIKVTQALMDADEFVFRMTCRALTFWNAGDKNGKYRAVVGMSQGEISRSDFVRRIKRILRDESAEASWISIKLTETAITTMNAVAERNLKILGDQKFSIIVDKFGSGYGDLEKILSLPVTQINIDHSLLLQAMEKPEMKDVVKGIVNLFHDISIFVCATDVSSKEEEEIAEEIGCDYLIGDYLGLPMEDSSYVKYIDAYFEEGRA